MLNFTRIFTTLRLSLVSLISFRGQADTMSTDTGSTTTSGALFLRLTVTLAVLERGLPTIDLPAAAALRQPSRQFR